MEDWAVDFVGMDYDGLLAGDVYQLLKGITGNDRPGGVLWVALERFRLVNSPVRIQGEQTYLMIINFVLGRMRVFSSSTSNCHPFSSWDLHKLISAPKDSGTEYSCWYVG